ncbi:MAG: YbaN family protein [Bacteroidetes bacterium]|nr:YbaN family protein [Bacteroidota bacterium]
MNPLKLVYAIAGLLFTGTGIIGIFIPGLPTTPFLLLALWCFARSSDRLHNWLLNHKVLGTFIRDYQEKGALPLKLKIISLTTIFLSLTLAVWFHESATIRIVVITLGLTGVWVILRIPTLKN